ncbi:MAG: UvrD-helicase domain-containing protein [Selenomonadaceae bacterium]|nr:UvrD-helicase domain-containing protein [Selenomonadaceae bacterium]
MFRNLNPQQVEAVNKLDGPLLIMAGAGSGKTRVLTCRIANLIAQGISPWNILAITFTNKAANEMKTRAEKLIGTSAKSIVLNTFHSFCAQVLRREIEITNKFTRNFAIYDANDSKALIKRCIVELKLEEDKFSNTHFRISDMKNNLISVEEFKEKAATSDIKEKNIAMIYDLYQHKLRENNALDFDDLIFIMVKIFKRYPEVLDRYQERFQYISVDEYQDTNYAQYVLTKMLAEKYKNICVVGDADQSIYGWRGADMRNILNFERDYPKAHVVKLEQNYRSTKTILTAANSVIENNFDRKPKTLWTKNESGEKIKFVLCRDDKEEASKVAQEITRLIERENFRYNDIALLYRTNAQSRMFEERFLRSEIPYLIVGGLKFYDRKEIKDIIAYLHVIGNPRDSVHMMRIINTPRRGLGLTNLERLNSFAEEAGLSIFEVVSDKNLFAQVPNLTAKFREGIQKFIAMMTSFMESANDVPIDELINIVIKESGYMKMIKDDQEDGKAESISREENIGEFINSAKDFVEMNPSASIQDFLNHIALISDIDSMQDEGSYVKLMTIHAAKGLEFPVVFVVGMEEGLFPSVNSFSTESELEEERRTCYVAFTRAEKKLYITSAAKRMVFGKIRERGISRFVDEIPKYCLESSSFSYAQQSVKPTFKNSVPNSYKPPTAYHAAQIAVKPATKNKSTIDWNVGDTLNHKKWGLGTVMAADMRDVTVQFANPEVGIKKLKISIAPITKL